MIADNSQNHDIPPVENTSSTLAEALETQSSSAAEAPSSSEMEVTRDQLSLGKRLLNWRTLVPLIVVIALLIYFAGKANINPRQIWISLQSANMLFFAAAFVVYYLSFPIRATRWRILLQNVGYTRENGIELPRFWKLVEIIFISFFANAVVPAKLGDLYRAFLLRQEANVSTTRSFGTVLAERLLDLIVLLLLFIPALIISLHKNLPSQLQLGLEIVLVAVVLGIVGLFILRLAREPIAKLVPPRFRENYYQFQEGTLGSFQRLPILSLLTVGVWLCESFRFFFVALSLNLLTGDATHILTAAIFIGLGEALLTIIPATGGGIGIVEGGMLAMIGLFYHGADAANRTAAAILLDRTISLFSILVLGLVVFLIAFGRKAAHKPSGS